MGHAPLSPIIRASSRVEACAEMKILLITNKKNSKALDGLFQLAAFFDAQGIEHVDLDVSAIPDSSFPYTGLACDVIDPRLTDDIDMVITLGGDGTILHGSRIAAVLGAPIMGINYGHLGFLTNLADNGAIAVVADALAGEINPENRMNLHIRVECEGDDEEPPDEPREFYALNEIAIARGALGHIVDFDFSISGDHIAHMRGDGLIIATATGSTAYSLSAGGPLVGPLHRGMIVVPLVPHTLNTRAIVTEHHDVIEMNLKPGSASTREVSLFADGDALPFSRPVLNVIVSVGENPTVMLHRHETSFYKQISRFFFD